MLCVWLPLNGDLHNQGISDLNNANIQSNVVVDNNGKIGKCYTNSGTTANVATPISFSANQFSLCAWVKINTRRNNWCRAVGLSGSGTYMGLACEHTNGTSLGFHYYKTIDGTNTSIFDTYPLNFSTGIWAHFTMCYDGTKFFIYKDGSLLTSGNANKSNIQANMNTLYLFGGTANNSSQCSLNDVRIYDHCLSAAEVHEIAQGLVVHYKLDYPGVNLLLNSAPHLNATTSWATRSGGTLSIQENSFGPYGYVIRSTYNTSSCGIHHQPYSTSTLVNGETYTFSGWARASKACKATWYNEWMTTSSTVDLTTDWQFFSHTGVIDTSRTYHSDVCYPTTVESGMWVEACMWKLEKGDGASKWIPHTSDSIHSMFNDETTKIEDSSGYNHHGTIVGSVTASSSPRYVSALVLNSTSSHVQVTNLATTGFTNSYSFVWWANSNSTTNMHWGFKDGTRVNGLFNGNLWNTGDSSNNPLYKPGTTTQVTVTEADVWHHWAMTGDGSACKVYKDGVHVATAKTVKGLGGTELWFNGWQNSTSYTASNLALSDFRIYATTLSATDILSLYHTSAKVDNLDDLHTFELQEGGPARVTKQGQIKGDIIQETYSPFAYDIEMYVEPDGSEWAHIFHHNNPASYRFASTDTFTSSVYIDENRWFNFKSCDYLDKYEFLAKVKRTDTDTEVKYRWIQPSSPFTSTFNNTKSESVTKITTTGYTSCPFGGLYHVSDASWLAMNNGVNNNWFGATGAWTAWNGGIPGWASTASGNAIKSGSVDIYVRLDNTSYSSSDLPAKLFKDFKWQGNNFIEL